MKQLFIVELSTKEMQTINGWAKVLWAALGRLIKKAVQDYKDHFLRISKKLSFLHFNITKIDYAKCRFSVAFLVQLDARY